MRQGKNRSRDKVAGEKVLVKLRMEEQVEEIWT
jgi:hypothetical protein